MAEMTAAEAAEVLEMRAHRYHPGDKITKATEMAVSVLRGQQEREKGCGIIWRRRTFGGYKRVVCPECGTVVETEKPSNGDFPYCGGCGKIIFDASQPFCCWCGYRLKEAQEDGRA